MTETVLRSSVEGNPLEPEVNDLGNGILALYELEFDEEVTYVDVPGESVPFSGPMQSADELPDRAEAINPTCSQGHWTVDELDPNGGLYDTADVEGD